LIGGGRLRRVDFSRAGAFNGSLTFECNGLRMRDWPQDGMSQSWSDMPLKMLLEQQGGLGHLAAEIWEGEADHPGSKQLVAYWESKRKDGGLPLREDINPHEIVRLLPNVSILEPRNGDWAIRLTGTGVIDRIGQEVTTKTIGEIYEPETARRMIETYDAVVANRKPSVMKARLLGFGIAHALAESPMLPIIARDRQTVHIFGGIFFMDQKAR
jgi:hypothetical protein